MCVPPLIILHKLADRDALVMRYHLQRLYVFLVSCFKLFDMFDLRFLAQYALSKPVILLIYPRRLLLLVRKVECSFGLWAAYRCDALELHRCSGPLQLTFLFL